MLISSDIVEKAIKAFNEFSPQAGSQLLLVDFAAKKVEEAWSGIIAYRATLAQPQAVREITVRRKDLVESLKRGLEGNLVICPHIDVGAAEYNSAKPGVGTLLGGSFHLHDIQKILQGHRGSGDECSTAKR